MDVNKEVNHASRKNANGSESMNFENIQERVEDQESYNEMQEI